MYLSSSPVLPEASLYRRGSERRETTVVPTRSLGGSLCPGRADVREYSPSALSRAGPVVGADEVVVTGGSSLADLAVGDTGLLELFLGFGTTEQSDLHQDNI